MKSGFLHLICIFSLIAIAEAYNVHVPTSRKAFLNKIRIAVTTSFTVSSASAASAFDGQGSSAYSGRTPSSKAELKRSYQARVIQDVKDFVQLGQAIDNSQLEGDAWVRFFITYQRREPDAVGRTYAALLDLVGNKEFSGCGILLANTFSKPGKPPDNTPSVKAYNSMAKAFESIQIAKKNDDLKKAKLAYDKAATLLNNYLVSVELPPLTDVMYQS
jgi:hypothetical protein